MVKLALFQPQGSDLEITCKWRYPSKWALKCVCVCVRVCVSVCLCEREYRFIREPIHPLHIQLDGYKVWLRLVSFLTVQVVSMATAEGDPPPTSRESGPRTARPCRWAGRRWPWSVHWCGRGLGWGPGRVRGQAQRWTRWACGRGTSRSGCCLWCPWCSACGSWRERGEAQVRTSSDWFSMTS